LLLHYSPFSLLMIYTFSPLSIFIPIPSTILSTYLPPIPVAFYSSDVLFPSPVHSITAPSLLGLSSLLPLLHLVCVPRYPILPYYMYLLSAGVFILYLSTASILGPPRLLVSSPCSFYFPPFCLLAFWFPIFPPCAIPSRPCW